ncbi:FAD-dependent oxidoreductase [Spirochaeta isovalerica]|uniref:Thioredoxin reductase (NADPH) n=1 Tax=Spirochaeta isovalerica TaxID=150 RepID=A0A841R4I7_9SPIO|nr:FAD-dependent oxidoreductase [Spirochaeta isovalerica]MBB6478726.1 thioredoxin reductase (NADPH) [Spirochaeta isovalerica]
MTDRIIEINADKFDEEVLKGDKVVVDFYSTECPPCEALATKYDALSELYGNDIKFVKIFRQGNKELATSLGVTGSPTVLFYEKGERTGDTLSGGVKRSDMMRNLDALLDEPKVKEIHGKIKPVETECEVIVLGGGPAGLTAGLYLAQAHNDVILVDTQMPGGYVATTHQVSNYPGFIDPQPGFMLSHYMSEQATAAGVKYRAAVEITSIDLEKKEVVVDNVETLRAKKIIVSTGSNPRPLGIPGEIEFRGDGISYCATCDAKYFDDKEVVVIGGGNSAIEEALFITKFAKKVKIIHQFAELQANKEAQEKAFANDKIEFYLEHEPREFKKHGTMDMEVVVEDLKTKEMKSIRTNGIFVFVGFQANLDGMEGQFELDNWGYVKTDDFMKTNKKDIFAVGDLRSKAYRQITTAVADGTIAAITASRELDSE